MPVRFFDTYDSLLPYGHRFATRCCAVSIEAIFPILVLLFSLPNWLGEPAVICPSPTVASAEAFEALSRSSDGDVSNVIQRTNRIYHLWTFVQHYALRAYPGGSVCHS
jgi:hypothetical protein